MSPFPVIEVHNVLMDGPLRLFTAFKLHSPYQFCFQGLEEGLDDSIIVTVALAGHGRQDAVLLQRHLILSRHILTAPV